MAALDNHTGGSGKKMRSASTARSTSKCANIWRRPTFLHCAKANSYRLSLTSPKQAVVCCPIGGADCGVLLPPFGRNAPFGGCDNLKDYTYRSHWHKGKHDRWLDKVATVSFNDLLKSLALPILQRSRGQCQGLCCLQSGPPDLARGLCWQRWSGGTLHPG